MRYLSVLVLTAVALAACGGSDPVSEDSTAAAPDGDWELIDGMASVAGFPITLSISGTEVSGRAACNSYFGTATIDGSTVAFGELGQTEMACGSAVMDTESRFLAALISMESFTIDGDRLTLTGPGIDLGFVPVAAVPTSALVGTSWVLETLIEGDTASSVSGDPALLRLDAGGTLTASTGCRTLTGRWVDNGGVIVVPELAADGECPDELWKQDSLVVTVIGDEFRAEVDDDILTLTSMGGDGLMYRAEG